jgi:hypothetical protein
VILGIGRAKRAVDQGGAFGERPDGCAAARIRWLSGTCERHEVGAGRFPARFRPSSSPCVISTDALEHCPEPDLPWIVDEIFGFATKMVYANVASYPAIKRLPNGENAHATQRDHLWWKDLLDDVSNRHPGVHYRFEIDQIERSLKTLFKRQKRAHRIVG